MAYNFLACDRNQVGVGNSAVFRDVDGNEFIDTTLTVGPILLGYCYDIIDNAVKM